MSVLVRTAYYTVPLGVFTAGLYYWVKSDKTQARIKQNVVYHKPGGADPELIERNKRLIENITAITKGNINPTWEASQVKLAEREENRRHNTVKRSSNYYVPEDKKTIEEPSSADTSASAAS